MSFKASMEMRCTEAAALPSERRRAGLMRGLGQCPSPVFALRFSFAELRLEIRCIRKGAGVVLRVSLERIGTVVPVPSSSASGSWLGSSPGRGSATEPSPACSSPACSSRLSMREASRKEPLSVDIDESGSALSTWDLVLSSQSLRWLASSRANVRTAPTVKLIITPTSLRLRSFKSRADDTPARMETSSSSRTAVGIRSGR
mmetsp:Transcript_49063/g.116830  ORF Transcript_49063/g.116830 Transcript_49063/m.116830 type:complete len:202 (+) Transcript_49063:1038-1643(+)